MAVFQTGGAETESSTNVWNRELAERASQIFRGASGPAKHYAGLVESECKSDPGVGYQLPEVRA
jgi:hypothetical protein